jgi:DNA repair protein RecO (recombination protein O)
MLKQTEGIVLKSSVFGEADLIVTYLTRDYGLLKVFAKSPRKIKSRFGSSLEPLTYSTIAFIGREDANIPRLTQSDITMSFHSLREDFKCLLNITEMLELNLNFLPEREPNSEAFKLLLNTLIKLESDSSNRLYYLYYKIKFLEITGYLPRLDVCGRCGCPPIHHNFYIAHGSIICEKCIGNGKCDPPEAERLSDTALRFYRSFLTWRLWNINRIKAPEYLFSEITNLVDSHIKYIMSKPYKSGHFLK